MKAPTGDPTCPPHVREAKRLRLLIQERFDASNLEQDGGGEALGGEAHLGFAADDEGVAEVGVLVVNESSLGATRTLTSDLDEQRTIQPRPLVRTPVRNVRTRRNDVLIANIISRQDRDAAERVSRQEREVAEREDRCRQQIVERRRQDAERRERRRDQVMNTALMMAMVNAINPAAGAALANTLAQQALNEENSDDDDAQIDHS